ncbi:MAG: UDP-N-acetylmuramoyl-tripeptide--D-alanyl-D-alanine ligase [Candidatus Omnitrophica bacterium]|nr:UDP-N-acetylmuramoyl-tripeptide--D-alanyl-D-alanine ligase [Candidatus Omnitrophota bacterium]MDD5352796.1 UDP-N-acetylmuramoyl-tripeptide--D-alanyl-D-alanine ligase [Candidatus Omnitrophota bacterium]MDD5550395.1 UDP-N-acetylmuramoyl-tripeptide--D-alanyl-D-alanine ligase [Candidatus Omnitrophota bacterium]
MLRVNEIAKATKSSLIRKSGHNLINGVSTDSRTLKKNDIFFALRGDNFDGHNFINEAIKKGAAAVVISKQIKINDKAKINILKVKDTTIALGDLAGHYRCKNNIPLIAVTGSAGKTTAKDIIAAVLGKEYNVLKNLGTHNNHIGVPETLFKLNNRHNICVLELGTNHFGEISYLSKIAMPQVAVITNIGPSHLEFFKDLDGVFKEKKNIIKHLAGAKIVLLNGDDVFLRKMKLPQQFKVFYFGKESPCDFMASGITTENNNVKFVFNKKHKFCLPTLGRFHVYNALAAIGCGLIFGVGTEKIKAALEDFQFLSRRLSKIDCSDFSILDDTYNSNPLSLEKAVETLTGFKTSGRRILVMGDMLELGSRSQELHRQMGSFVAHMPIDIFITLGKFSKFAADTAKSESKIGRGIYNFDSKADLIDFLRKKIKSGDIILIKGSRLMQMEDIVSSLTKVK